MKKTILLFVLLAGPITGISQTFEAGIFGGTSYYLGDFNPTTHFVRPELAGGIFGRYNHSNHVALRLNVSYGQVSGTDTDTPYSVLGRNNEYSFSATITEVSLQGEVNFLPYVAGEADSRYTPYIFFGAGGFMFNNDVLNEMKYRRLSYLVGMGLKFHLTQRLAGGLDWGLRNTTTDQLDGAPGIGNPKNNDWYSFAGLSLTFRFQDRCRAICPY